MSASCQLDSRNDAPGQRLSQIARDSGSSLASALVGLALGGPLGAVAGAAGGAAGAGLVDLVRSITELRGRRMARTLERAAEITGGDVRTLEELLLSDERRLELAAGALEASASCAFADKLHALAAVVASAADASTDNDLARVGIVVRALRDLDEPHVRLLVFLSTSDELPGASPEMLEDVMGIPTPELRPVVRTLELHGLIVDEGRFDAGLPVRWKIAELGVLCVRLISKGAGATRAANNM